MSTSQNRMPLIDAFKAIASQLILLHHLSSYGPLAASAREILPGTMGWLFDYGRMAVQVFLVIAGFLAARGLSGHGQALSAPLLPLLWKRYLRLIIPFMVAIALAIVGSAIADHWMDDDAIPDRATLGQWLAHATLLHGILGAESLSAGVWYVAIDFQLFALMALLLWLGRRAYVAPTLVLSLTLASLFLFNRDTSLDNWAPYFFGAYGLGAAAWWASGRHQMLSWLGAIATVATAALVIDFRLRILVALIVALTLGLSRRTGLLERWPDSALLNFFGQISYSVFLVHFPILLLTNAFFAHFELSSPGMAIFGLLTAWTASLVVATGFYRWVESPAASQRLIGALGWLWARASDVGQLAGRMLRLALRRIVFGRS